MRPQLAQVGAYDAHEVGKPPASGAAQVSSHRRVSVYLCTGQVDQNSVLIRFIVDLKEEEEETSVNLGDQEVG